MKIPYYIGGITKSSSSGDISLEHLCKSILEPKPQVLSLFEAINEASKEGDKKKKGQLKEQLPFFTISAIFNGRRKYDNIIEFNPIAQLDFDGLSEQEAEDFKFYLFDHYPQIVMSFLSPSRKGVKAIIRIPKIDFSQGIEEGIKEYKEYYKAIESEFSNYKGFDPAPKNLALPLFLSYDYFMFDRSFDETKEWSLRESLEDTLSQDFPLPIKPYKKLKSNNRNESRAYNTVRKAIRDILSSPGHYQLRTACLIFGTRCGAGYVDYSDAKREVEDLVRSNAYLSKGVAGYIKTALWSLNEGYKTPKYY
tara:strand:+ start:3067 stop:3990 length:924 start_codon:yes stop_codon:yes gene_type:complete